MISRILSAICFLSLAAPAAAQTTDKDALVKALRESLAYCDKIYNGTTDANRRRNGLQDR